MTVQLQLHFLEDRRMVHRATRSVFIALLLAIAVVFALPGTAFGQTFRGGINGTVTDQSGRSGSWRDR
jgi:hypothetical protein